MVMLATLQTENQVEEWWADYRVHIVLGHILIFYDVSQEKLIVYVLI